MVRPLDPNTIFSRRSLLTLFGGGACATILASCGQSAAPTAPADLAFADYSGARLSAILRRSFISATNELTEDQIRQWSASANASLEGRLLDDWREVYAEVAQRREGDDLAELFGASTSIFSDRLVDVSDLAEELGANNGSWIDAARDAAIVDGTWRAIPWVYTALVLNYREDFFAAAGAVAPATYDDLLQAANQLRDAGQPLPGFSMNPAAPNDSANLAYSMMWSFGGHEVDESGQRVTLDSAGTRAALAFFAELSAVAYPPSASFDEGGNNEAFLQSSISMTQNASSIYWKALREAPDVAAAMNHVKLPAGPAGFHQLVELNSLAIFEHSRNIDAAKDWIRFMNQPAQLGPRAAASLSFFTPSLRVYADDPAMPWNTDPKLAGTRGIYDGGHLPGWPGPPSLEANLVYENTTIVRMFQAIGTREMSIDEAIVTATTELRRVYET